MVQMLGRYELLRPLARGGMAELFLARRRGPGGVEKRLVIKRVRRERATDPRFIEMFVREARLSMSFAHKNIVPVFDFGRAGEELFLVMEYVDGVDLGAVLARASEQGTAPDPLVIAFIGEEACQALSYVHETVGLGSGSAVIHRDVSPSNVLLSYRGEVKLFDFGLATSETEIGSERRVRGTPAYMAPEQARGEPLDPRTDVFALGLVLWEALAGRRLYTGADPLAVVEVAKRAEVPPVDEDRAPAPLRQIVERATRADPDQRFADARAMQVALDEFLVDARAARERRTPAHQLLADWLSAVFPLPAPVPSGDAVAVPAGPVATFLDDGEEEVAQARTMRSAAATMGESEPAAPPVGRDVPATRDPLASRAEPAPRRGAPVLIGVLVLGVAAAGLFLWQRGRRTSSPAAVTDAAAIARAAPPLDAAHEVAADAAHEVGADAAPPPAAVDARPHGKSRPPRLDAGPAVAPGTLQLDSTPWATVRIAGRRESCKETPCTLRLPPGTYRVRLANPLANLEKEVEVTIESGRTMKVRESLTR